ncbi:MAG: heparinase II/III family protein [Bacteroidota bacterium]
MGWPLRRLSGAFRSDAPFSAAAGTATASLTLSERATLAKLSANRARRAVVARALRSAALRWWLAPPVADELLIVPPDLRTPDPSFLTELAAGQLGLGGSVASLHGRSPFLLPAPSPAWARELHGFGWLRHLRCGPDGEARAIARRLAGDWLTLKRQRAGIPFEPQVVARRIISWLGHADLLLEDSDPRFYAAAADCLGGEVQFLAGIWGNAHAGYPRLVCLAGLLFAALCVAGQDRRLERTERLFVDELGRQILADGGHVSRNPGVPVQLLLDFLPLRQCYAARELPAPDAFHEAMDRMISFLEYMRRGDGALARFNGMSRTEADALATVLGYVDSTAVPLAQAPVSRYERLERGQTVVIVDVGPPPPLELAAEAQAGCLSFEMSVGPHALLVNGGAPGPAHERHRALARATASHNTLCLSNTSSSRLVRARLLEQVTGSPPLRLPQSVDSELTEDDGTLVLECRHDGYLEQFGLLHTRRLSLSSDGLRFEGVDMLGPESGVLRLKRDVPFAIHFHLPCEVVCRSTGSAGTAEIEAGADCRWRFVAAGARLSIEQGQDFAHFSGPQRSMQIVLRGACPGESIVSWRLEKI